MVKSEVQKNLEIEMPESAWKVKIFQIDPEFISVGLYWNDKPQPTHIRILNPEETTIVRKFFGCQES